MMPVFPFSLSLLTRTCVAAVLLMICQGAAQAAVPASIPDVALRAAKQVFRANDSLSVSVSIQNPTSKPMKILKWNTPLEGAFNADMFDVRRDGLPVKYIGKLVKRGQPTAADYVTLSPGDSLTVSLDMAKGYEIARKGAYTVSYRKALAIKEGSGAALLRKMPANANTVSFYLEQDRPRAKAASTPSFKQAPQYSGCSASQRSDLDAALSGAESIAAIARNDLNNTPVSQRSGAQRYKTWFGAYTSSRYATASSHFNNIYDSLANKTVNFHCDCSDSYYAYVYSWDPYNIHLCNLFWSAPLNGTDSKSGTLVHEMSHFTVNGGTDDHVYGKIDAKSLAVSNPDQALDNADNHEYFAENTPSLPMTPAGDSYEPDNSSSQATLLKAGIAQTHSIDPVGDVDWFKFTLSGVSNIVLETSGASGDTRMWLYNSAVQELAFDDDGGAGTFARIVKNGLTAGTYYAKVDDYGNDSVISSYSLLLSVASAPPTPSKPAASDLTYAGSIHLNWAAVSGATEYRVYRCANGSSTSSCVYRGATATTSYVDGGAQAQQVYYYRIRACNSIGCSAFSGADPGSARRGVGIAPILELLLLQ